MDWFTADTHLGHRNIIKFCKRPFINESYPDLSKTVEKGQFDPTDKRRWDIEKHDDTLLANINEVVQVNDRLFHVGDFAHRGGHKEIPTYRRRINCKNVFILPGNHDRESQLKGHFEILPQCFMYENDGFRMVLCHYAMRVWHHSHHGAGMLYGHSHGGLPPVPGAPSFDVGVDVWSYRPISLIEVKHEMTRLCALKGIKKEHLHHENGNGE